MEQYQFQPIKEDLVFYHNISKEPSMNQSLPYHRHDAYEIYLFLRGNAYMYLEHTCYPLNPGDLLIINPNELHRSVVLDHTPYERIGINLKRSTLERLSSSQTCLLQCFEHRPHGEQNLVHLSDDVLNQYTNLTTKLGQAHQQEGFGHDLLLDSYLIQLLIFVNQQFLQSNASYENVMPQLVQDTILYIRNHLSEDITLSDLSDLFHYNGTYISSIFKEHTGLTLRSFILDQRINFAKKLLLEGRTVGQAGEESGFKDYANFIRSFTKMTGISPGKYRKQS